MNFLTFGTWQQKVVCANLNGIHVAQYSLVVVLANTEMNVK